MGSLQTGLVHGVLEGFEGAGVEVGVEGVGDDAGEELGEDEGGTDFEVEAGDVDDEEDGTGVETGVRTDGGSRSPTGSMVQSAKEGSNVLISVGTTKNGAQRNSTEAGTVDAKGSKGHPLKSRKST